MNCNKKHFFILYKNCVRKKSFFIFVFRKNVFYIDFGRKKSFFSYSLKTIRISLTCGLCQKVYFVHQTRIKIVFLHTFHIQKIGISKQKICFFFFAKKTVLQHFIYKKMFFILLYFFEKFILKYIFPISKNHFLPVIKKLFLVFLCISIVSDLLK